jgi:thioesterase domain-containing protein
MAEHYASLIQQRWPQGPYHLLGQSAGGWYAFAVAAALIRRGGSIGILTILDSGPTALISKRLRASLLLRKLGRKLPEELMRLPWRHPRNLGPHLSRRLSSLQEQWQGFRTPSPGSTSHAAAGAALDAPGTSQQDYFAAVHQIYRPPVLPVAVHLYTTRKDARLKRLLWQAHARGGISHQLLFEHHYQYHHAECGPLLAEVVGNALHDSERASTR